MKNARHAVTLGRRGQVTLPSEFRKQLDLREGDRINFIRRGDELILRPVKQTLLDLRGSAAVSGPQDFSAIRRQVIQEYASRVVHGPG